MPGPNTYRVTWSFVEAGGGAWNEVYYATGSSPTALLDTPPGVAQARIQMLSTTATWQKIRVADVNNKRSTAQRVVNFAGIYPVDQGPLPAGTALICNLVGTPSGSRKLWLRGLDGAEVMLDPTTGRPVFSPVLINNFNQMLSGLSAAGYGIRVLSQTPQYVISKVDGIANPPYATLTVTTPMGGVPPNYTAPNRVVIGGADKKTLPGLNGHWSVVTGSASTFQINYVVANAQVITNNCGKVKLESYPGVNIFNAPLCSPAYFGTHATKNSFFNSRGARRAVRIRTLV